MKLRTAPLACLLAALLALPLAACDRAEKPQTTPPAKTEAASSAAKAEQEPTPARKFVKFCTIATPEQLREALQAGANPNTREEQYGVTPLMVVAARKTPETENIRVLLDAGAEIEADDKNGRTPLMWAAYRGAPENVRTLLDAGTDVNAKSYEGVTALMDATYRGAPEIIRMLLDAGADVNARTNANQRGMAMTALMLAAFRDNPECLRLLIDAGADVNATAPKGGTALMLAAGKGGTENVRLLLAAGAEPGMKYESGGTALDEAEAEGHHEAAQLLREALAR